MTEAEILAYAIAHPELQKQGASGASAWKQATASSSSVDLYS